MIRIGLSILAATLPLHASWEIKASDERIDVLEDGEVLTSYHAGRVPFVYPLPSASGANLARHWPIEDDVPGEDKDHPHHRSFWLSHGEVNGYDFWAWTGKGEPKILHRKHSDVSAEEDHAAFTVHLDWTADGKSLLHEVRRYHFSRPDEKSLAIRVDSRIEAVHGDVEFGDTKEGTFAIRVDRTLRLKGKEAKGHILNSEGLKDGDTWGKRAKWVAFHGPDERNEPAVLAIFDHPSNLRHPTWWHARDYGLLGANPFGIHHFEKKKDATLGDHVVKKGEPFEQRYLLLLHHGTVESANLEKTFESFAK